MPAKPNASAYHNIVKKLLVSKIKTRYAGKITLMGHFLHLKLLKPIPDESF